MIVEPYVLLLVLLGTLVLFIWGHWRYDIVAALALLVSVLIGAVPFSRAFSGFGSPAVITVACVMIITQAIASSGVMNWVVKRITPVTKHVVFHVASLSFITALLSAFMNNVGALALMMPIAIQTAIKSKRSPSVVLMPLAFASVLGGLTTAIGTPPNIIIATFRQQVTGHSFAMFDYTPVGFTVAVIGILFISFLGWRLIPHSRKAPTGEEDLFKIQDYITEVKVPENSPVIGKTMRELEKLIEGEFMVLGLIRSKRKRLIIPPTEVLKANDVLIVEATHDDLQNLLAAGKLELVTGETVSSDVLRSKNIALIEAVVPQGSRVEGRSSQSIRLRSRYHVNLLAISREGSPFRNRLNHVKLRAGDVVLLQGEVDTLQETVVSFGMLPLVERGVEVGIRRRAFLPLAIFAFAIIMTATRLLPVQIAFAMAVIVMVLFNILPVRKMYESIDWSIVVLLGAMIPIGGALQATGGTQLIASTFISFAGQYSHAIILGLLMLITMTLSDVMNNAATTVVMAPIAMSVASAMHVGVDPFLMTVAVGASCSFLTPIAHQNNTLVMGPGGYHFFDYFRMGLPLELIVLVTAVPLILWFWPM